MPWWESGGGRQRGEESSGLNDLVDGTSKKKASSTEGKRVLSKEVA